MKNVLMLMILVFAGCKENAVQNAPPPDENSVFVKISGAWKGSYAFKYAPEYNHPCGVNIENNNNIYTINVNENGMDFAKYYEGSYRCEPFADQIHKQIHYALIDVNTNDTLFVIYSSEQITGDSISSFSVANYKKENWIFCYNN